MSKVILLAVDTTSHTTAAADLASELATGTGDRIVVLHVHEFAVGRFGRMQVDCADGDGERVVDEIVSRLRRQGVTAEADIRNEKINYKVREHSLAKVPKMLVVGAKEVENRTVAVRTLGGKDQEVLALGEAVARLTKESAPPAG